MADISMCNGKDCPISESCYRFTAPTNEPWQGYSEFNYDKKDGVCLDFWDNSGYRKGALYEKDSPTKRIRIKKIKRKNNSF